MCTKYIQEAILRSAVAFVVVISVALDTPTFAQSSEGTLTGPDFNGSYVLVSARDTASETAPMNLHILQSADSVHIEGTFSDGKEKWSTFQISTEWIEDESGGRAKAFFDGGALITERYRDTASGRYGHLDRWTFLGTNTVRVCRSAYIREYSGQDEQRSGCAAYSRKRTAR